MLNFPLLMECNSHLFRCTSYVSFICMKGRGGGGGGSSGSLLSFCLGEPEDRVGVARVFFLFLNVMFCQSMFTCCICCISENIVYKKKSEIE